MLEIIENLKRGNAAIVGLFVAAENLWNQLLPDIQDLSVEDLGNRLQRSQGDFIRACGGRNLGKAVMAWSAFAHLYSYRAGFGHNIASAKKLAQAFEASGCSTEVKSDAREAANLYGVEDID